MTKPLITAIFCALCLTSSAQKFKIGLGPILSFATDDFRDYYYVAVGAEGTMVYKPGKHFEAFGQFGLHHFMVKSEQGLRGYSLTSPAIDAIPILVGGRFVSKHFLAGVAVGYHTFGGGDGPAISPQVGYRISKFDILFNYTTSNVYKESWGYFGFKAYYYIFSK